MYRVWRVIAVFQEWVDSMERADSYRARADEIFAVTEWVTNPSARLQLIETAHQFQRMAETVERMDKLEELAHSAKARAFDQRA